jgi:hypothetical protein
VSGTDDDAANARANYSSATSFASGLADLFEITEEEALDKVLTERNISTDRIGIYDMETQQFFPKAPRQFMGVTNWSKVPGEVDVNQANLYMQGVFFPALVFVGLAIITLIGALMFTIGRCPCCFFGRACCFLFCFNESYCVPLLKRPCIRRVCCAKPERRVICFGFPMCFCPRSHPVMGEGAEKGYIYSGGLQINRDGER